MAGFVPRQSASRLPGPLPGVPGGRAILESGSSRSRSMTQATATPKRSPAGAAARPDLDTALADQGGKLAEDLADRRRRGPHALQGTDDGTGHDVQVIKGLLAAGGLGRMAARDASSPPIRLPTCCLARRTRAARRK